MLVKSISNEGQVVEKYALFSMMIALIPSISTEVIWQ